MNSQVFKSHHIRLGISMLTLLQDILIYLMPYIHTECECEPYNSTLPTGQERYRSTLSTSYYKNAHAVVLVYSTMDLESFTDVHETWLSQIHIQYGNDATDKLPVILVGTKSDLVKKHDEQQERVKKRDGRGMKASRDRLLGPIHCSAKTGRNVEKVFTKIAEELAARQSQGHVQQQINITKVSTNCTC